MHNCKMKRLCSVIGLLLCAGISSLEAASPGDEVVVVYNTRLPDSKVVADYYAELRQVPTNQVFGFGLSTNEDMSRAEFRDVLQRPLARLLEDKKLWHIASHIIHATTNQPGGLDWKVVESKIRYAVLCYGVPLRILKDPNLSLAADDRTKASSGGPAAESALCGHQCRLVRSDQRRSYGNSAGWTHRGNRAQSSG